MNDQDKKTIEKIFKQSPGYRLACGSDFLEWNPDSKKWEVYVYNVQVGADIKVFDSESFDEALEKWQSL